MKKKTNLKHNEMKYRILEYKDHFKVQKEITKYKIVTHKWYELSYWLTPELREEKVEDGKEWVFTYDTKKIQFWNPLIFQTIELAKEYIEKQIEKENTPKIHHPIIHEFNKDYDTTVGLNKFKRHL